MKLKGVLYSVGIAVVAGLILKTITKPRTNSGAVIGPTDSTTGDTSSDPFSQVENI